METERGKLSLAEQAYYGNIDDCALGAIDRVIKNSQPQHACYIMTKMFSLASKTIKLYTGSLVRDVEGEPVYADNKLITAVKSFLCQSTSPSLKIIVQHDVDGGIETHPLFKIIEEIKSEQAFTGKVELRKINPTIDEVDNHFIVMDDAAYRLELDHEPCKAIANFNDKSVAEKISNFFDDIFNSGSELYKV